MELMKLKTYDSWKEENEKIEQSFSPFMNSVKQELEDEADSYSEPTKIGKYNELHESVDESFYQLPENVMECCTERNHVSSSNIRIATSGQNFGVTLSQVKQELEEGWSSIDKVFLKKEESEITTEETNFTEQVNCDHPFNSVKNNEEMMAEDKNEYVNIAMFGTENDGERPDSHFPHQSHIGIVKLEDNKDIPSSSNHCQYNEEQNYNFLKFDCHFCDFVTKEAVTLKKHIQSIHQQFECDLCNYSASVEFSLKRHMGTEHSQRKKYDCDICDHSAESKDYLKTHLRDVHSQVDTHLCHLCSFSATTEDNLKNHMTCIHTQKEQQQRCHLCTYKTYHNAHLMVHVNTVHLEVKNHKCNLCNFISNEKSYLEKHVSECHSRPKNLQLKITDVTCATTRQSGSINSIFTCRRSI